MYHLRKHHRARRPIDPFTQRVDRIHGQLGIFQHSDAARRDEFRHAVDEILEADRKNFYALGEVRYRLHPTADGKEDWRVRDINRLLTRHREDRPIEDARRWAKLALALASTALLCSVVSAVADFDGAVNAMQGLVGRGADVPAFPQANPPSATSHAGQPSPAWSGNPNGTPDRAEACVSP